MNLPASDKTEPAAPRCPSGWTIWPGIFVSLLTTAAMLLWSARCMSDYIRREGTPELFRSQNWGEYVTWGVMIQLAIGLTIILSLSCTTAMVYTYQHRAFRHWWWTMIPHVIALSVLVIGLYYCSRPLGGAY